MEHFQNYKQLDSVHTENYSKQSTFLILTDIKFWTQII